MDLQVLSSLYHTKTDEELLQLVMEVDHLTQEARVALFAELSSRGVGLEHVELAPNLISNHGQRGRDLDRGSASARPLQLYTGEFIAEVLGFYRRNRGIFIRLVFPAVLLGAFVYLLQRHEIAEIQRSLPRGVEILQHKMELLEVGLWTWGSFLISWIISCFSFGAVCVATEQIKAGLGATFKESFEVTCKRVRWFLLLCLVLFVILIVSVGTALLISQVILWATIRPYFGHLSSWTVSLMSYSAFAVGALLLSRLSLAIPGFILDDCKTVHAILLSKQLTRRKTPILAVLLFKSVVGGYVAGMLPFWLAGWIPASVNLPTWFGWVLTGTSVAAVTIVEPVMFIGFALLYLKATATSTTTEARAACN